MLAVFAFFTALVVAIHSSPLPKHARIITRDLDLAFSYDFVIIGGGTSGLTVADRLTEDNKTSVLVIEYGYLYPNESNIHVPGLLNPTPYQFNITSTPQRGLENATFAVPAAAVVGGGSTINGMFVDRGSAADYDAWVELGNPGWGWSDLLPYFKKSETFTPASANLAEEFTISWDDTAHGFDGPVKSSYPVFQYQSISKLPESFHRALHVFIPIPDASTENFVGAWHSLGVQTPQDPGNGLAKGVFSGPSSLDPSNKTRSDARTAHYDAVAGSRPNYHLLTGNAVGSINFVRQKATGVEWLNRKTFNYGYVNAKKEIILAAGAAHTPQILQLSGVGPKGLLYSQEIPVVVDLPGVGQNFQDQPTLYASYNFTSNFIPNADTLYTNSTYAKEQLALYSSSRRGPYTICKNSGNVVAFNSLPDTTQGYQSIINLIISQPPEDLYLPNTDPSIIAGYEAQRKIIRNLHNSTTSPVLETGFSSGSEVPLTLVKPLSRGSISISNRDPLDPPLVDWGTFTNPVDVEIMVAAVKKLRALMATTSMQELSPFELMPGPNVTSDDEIRAALKKQVRPTYSHLTSTCSMMKREYGGVVGPDLLVYGAQSLSIVDASIMPLIPATHTASTVYAVAEKPQKVTGLELFAKKTILQAADIIKARHQL